MRNGNGQKRAGISGNTDLLRVHFEFAHNLDGNFAPLTSGIPRSVDVAEGAVTHLLQNLQSFKPRVFGQLALCFAFFRNDALQNFGVNTLALGSSFLLVFLVGRTISRSPGLRCDVAVVASSSDRVVTVGQRGMLKWLVVYGRL